jgi:hypothetical protein
LNATGELQTHSLDLAQPRLRDELVEARLLVPMGIDGLYGRGGVFEQIVEGIDRVVCRKGQEAHGSRPTRLRFPPLFTREAFENTDYIELLDIYGYCFRHELAVDPARMQAFRQHEYVMVGTPHQAQDHRDLWVKCGMEVLDELGLEATAVMANDPSSAGPARSWR